MSIVTALKEAAVTSLSRLYNQPFTDTDFGVNLTKAEFEGDYTIVLFTLLKKTGKTAELLGNELGKDLVAENSSLFSGFNIIKGFLNLSVSDDRRLQLLRDHYNDRCFGSCELNGRKVMIEYSSPNTNKPLHLGHLRNNFLGRSVAEILKFAGHSVFKSCMVNDRGVHICKSMVAWQMFADGATPQTNNTKGDHFVGDYYVKFNDEYKREVAALIAKGMGDKDAEREAPIMKATRQMLQDWEAGEPAVMDLWKRMNAWVYTGFEITYKNIGSDFDKTYYESETYILGKGIVQQGLEKNVFERKEDGSVWINLTADGLDEKLVLRKDGTSVYITQDIGLAQQKYDEYQIDESIYVIGDEQNYHMKALKLIAQKLGVTNADSIRHLSYGMVELPSGKMKSREGTVVDADDLVDEMINTAQRHTEELGKVKDFSPGELAHLYKTIGLGAMKFYLLRVDPKKKMVFNPQESIDFHGFTGPFVQYTYARIKSILRKDQPLEGQSFAGSLLKNEKEVLAMAERYPAVVLEAADELDPSKIANYVFMLAKAFNSMLSELSVIHAESAEKKQLRLCIAMLTANILKSGTGMLGIEVPERM